MIFEFGDFRVDVDVERTREFYENHGRRVIESCGCNSCRNYSVAIENVSDKVKDFFTSLGLDLQKAAEAVYYPTEDDSVADYGVIFHLVGTMDDRSADMYIFDEDAKILYTGSFYELEENIKVGFTSSNVIILPKGFPRPCIQLELIIRSPWVLEEKLRMI